MQDRQDIAARVVCRKGLPRQSADEDQPHDDGTIPCGTTESASIPHQQNYPSGDPVLPTTVMFEVMEDEC